MEFKDAVRRLCRDVPSALLDMHFRRMPLRYVEIFTAVEIARHLRMLGAVTLENPVNVEFHVLAGDAYDVTVAGLDYTGGLACITTAVASDGLDLQGVELSPYQAAGDGVDEPSYFVVRLRVVGRLPGGGVELVTKQVRLRLAQAFDKLSAGDLAAAREAAAATVSLKVNGEASAPASPASEVELEGLILGGDFRLQGLLGSGGMGQVHLANQVSLKRPVVVKLAFYEGDEGRKGRERFSREALVLGRFNCPFIVPVYATGELPIGDSRMMQWLAMEYMAGGDLAQWVGRNGAAPASLAIRWMRQSLIGLQYAHRQGILHRDMKPANLLLTAEGEIKVGDFGLLKQQGQAPAAGITADGALLGTPWYMSPEQVRGEELDERSDIFSLGTTFYFILSGRLPWATAKYSATMVQICGEDAAPVRTINPSIPRPVELILSRMLVRPREDRYQDVDVILDEIAGFERRGLLRIADGGNLEGPAAVAAPPEPAAATPDYPPRRDAVDATLRGD